MTVGHLTTPYGAAAHLFYNRESRMVHAVPIGTAHLLEHLLFEREAGAVDDLFHSIGAECGAFTTDTQLTFYFKTPEHVDHCLKLLLDMVYRPAFGLHQLAREQQVIAHELRGVWNDPDVLAKQNLMQALFTSYSPSLAASIANEEVRDGTREQVLLCHQAICQPLRMLLTVVGDVEPQLVEKAVESYFDSNPWPQNAPLERLVQLESFKVREHQLVTYLQHAHPLVKVGVKDRPVIERGLQLLIRNLLTEIVLQIVFDPDGPLTASLLADGLIEEPLVCSYHVNSTLGYVEISGLSNSPFQLNRRLLTVISRLAQQVLPNDDFERRKRVMIGYCVQALDNIEAFGLAATDCFFDGIDLFSTVEAIRGLRLTQAQERLEILFNQARMASSFVLPEELADQLIADA